MTGPDTVAAREVTSKHVSICACHSGDAHDLQASPSPSTIGLASLGSEQPLELEGTVGHSGDAHDLQASPSPSTIGLASLGSEQPLEMEGTVGRAYPALQQISRFICLKGNRGFAKTTTRTIRQIFDLIRPKDSEASIATDARRIRRLCSRTRNSVVFWNPALLRATTSFHALQNFGQLFQNSMGSEETYAFSEPVSAIDVFVSHNWSTGRADKFLALALYFNLPMAFLAVAVGAAATAILTAFGVLPTFAATHPVRENFSVSISCRVTGLVVFYVTLLLGHELKGRLGCKGLRLFVDKAVIHQTDVELKREGIRHLAAFLSKSDRMVIVYTAETYLRKLWTVYELASMLVLKPMNSIVIIPTSLPKLVLLVFPIVSFNSIMHTLSRSENFWRLLGLGFPHNIAMMCTNALTLLLFLPIAVAQQKRWGQQYQELRRSVENFSIQSTLCACEEDRTLVFGNIAAFMQDVDLVSPGASQAEALEAFNGFVRSQLPTAIGTFVGCRAIPYKYTVVMSMPHLLCTFDVLGSSDLNSEARCTCIWALFYTTSGLAVVPIMFNIFQRASCEANWARSMMKCLMGICSVWAVGSVLFFMLGTLSETSNGALLAYLSVAVIWFVVAACLYHHRAVVDILSLRCNV